MLKSAPVALLALVFAASALSTPEKCVPTSDGEWHCGVDVTEADAAPLPQPERSAPPVMLIDPRRFGEFSEPTQTTSSSTAEPTAKAPTTPVAATSQAKPAVVKTETKRAAAAAKPPPGRTITRAASPTSHSVAAPTTKPAAPAPIEVPAPPAQDLFAATGFAVQLAVASSPRGFDALLRKIGPAARTSQRRKLQNGSWVLLMGSFTSIEAARHAVPAEIPGAFPRDLSTLKFR